MSLSIEIKDWYDLHKGYTLALEPGLTFLVGPNGAGKTTLLSQIADYAKTNNIGLWQYDNLHDGGQHAADQYTLRGDFAKVATAMTASEGENVALNFGNRVGEMGQRIGQAISAHQPLIILLDAIDSGASIDRARELAQFLSFVCDKDIKGTAEIYIIVAANHYELVKAPARCINVRTGGLETFPSYDKYAEFICSFEQQFPRVEAEKKSRRRRRP